MTVRQLLYHLSTQNDRLDDEVCVYLSEGGFPARSRTKVKSAGFGIDWEHGNFILITEEPVVRKNRKRRS